MRGAQSTLANVIQHARAHHVDVELAFLPNAVVLSVTDDGVGFDQGAEGFGLASLRGRLEELGGRLVVESGAGRGTRLRMEVDA